MGKWTSDAYYHKQGVAFETNMAKVGEALKALRRQGMIARQNFLCCGNCAATALGIQLDKSRAAGKEIAGAVYFHKQDAESALKYGTLYLGYGAGDPYESRGVESRAVGMLIVTALRSTGLDVKWSGDAWERIEVRIWRTPADQAEFEADGIMLPDCD